MNKYNSTESVIALSVLCPSWCHNPSNTEDAAVFPLSFWQDNDCAWSQDHYLTSEILIHVEQQDVNMKKNSQLIPLNEIKEM